MPGVSDWLIMATDELTTARKLKRYEMSFKTVAYLTQQSAEKSLKAFLVFKAQKIPRTHDLDRLLESCLLLDASFIALQLEAETLSPYAVYTRYPDDYFSIDQAEVISAIKHASKILKFVKTKIISKKLKLGQSIIF
jgi:HEPN domain-containing protein